MRILLNCSKCVNKLLKKCYKAHLNLAVRAYWIVSVTMYRLRKKGYLNVR